jgi:hypothetical protein
VGFGKPVPGAALDREHPLAPDLICCPILGNEGGRLSNLVPGRPHGTRTGSPVTTGTSLGYGVRSTSGALYSFGPANEIINLTSITVALGMEKIDGTNRNTTAFGLNDGDLATRCGTHCPWSDGTVYWDFGGASEPVSRVSVAGLNFGRMRRMVFTKGSRGMEIWQDGRLAASNAANTARTSSTATFNALSGTHDADEGNVAYFYVYAKQLPKDAVAWLSAEPFAMLAAQPWRRWFDMGAAPAGGLIRPIDMVGGMGIGIPMGGGGPIGAAA